MEIIENSVIHFFHCYHRTFLALYMSSIESVRWSTICFGKIYEDELKMKFHTFTVT